MIWSSQTSKQQTTTMQASITSYSPLPITLIKSRSKTSTLNPIFHRTKPCSLITLQNLQPQSPLISSTSKSQRILGPLRCGISSNGESANAGGKSIREWVEVAGEAISTAFPLWVTIGCVLGLMRPSSFNWVTDKLSIVGLSVIMLGMGMTLTLDDLRSALSMPKEILSGFFLQYSVSFCVLCYCLYNLFCPFTLFWLHKWFVVSWVIHLIIDHWHYEYFKKSLDSWILFINLYASWRPILIVMLETRLILCVWFAKKWRTTRQLQLNGVWFVKLFKGHDKLEAEDRTKT